MAKRRLSASSRASATGVIAHLLLAAWAVVALVPFLWMLSSSLKDFGQIFRFPPVFVPNPVIGDHYVRLLTDFPFATWSRNSVYVTAPVVVGQLLSCSLAAYAFARIQFKGRDRLFLFYVATMMIPFQITIIPAYILMDYLGLVDSLGSLVIPGVLGGPYGTFLLRQFFMTIPQELEEAARMDGAGPLRLYWSIVLPLSKPALATLAVFTFMSTWNDFLWPLIVISSTNNRTLPLGLAGMVGQYQTEWGLLMAAAVLSTIPMLIVFAAAQRYFVQGITITGMKA